MLKYGGKKKSILKVLKMNCQKVIEIQKKNI